MGKINKEWHLAHKMPRNPTKAQRLAWHVDHAAHCSCREIPAGILSLAARHGVVLPTMPQAAKSARD